MKKILLAVLLVLALSTPALAVILDLNISNERGTGLYGQLQFTQSNNTVTVSANYNSSLFTTINPNTGTPMPNFGVQDIYLNLRSSLIPTITAITPAIGGWGSATNPPTSNLRADGFGLFNLTAGDAAGGGDVRIPIVAMGTGFTNLFTIDFSSSVDVNNFLTANGDGVFAALHLAGYYPYDLNGRNISSEWLAATPIPGTVYLFGSGLAGLVGIARWRRRK